MTDIDPAAIPAATRLAGRRTGVSLTGTARIPGDKSISHRALLLGALAIGETAITGLLEGEDVRGTARALRALGVDILRDGPGAWRVQGVGTGGLMEPEDVLDMGNSGTSARLLAGLLASHNLFAVMTGDPSLRKRPMGRVIEPLERMGARFESRGGRLPLAILGSDALVPIRYALPVPSAQVKSAVLLAGLNTLGATTVIETQPTRDHTERMLRHFGVAVAEEPTEGGVAVTVPGHAELKAAPVAVPADPSSAAFPIVAALLVPGSAVHLPAVGLNPRRTGLFDTLLEMGAEIVIENRRVEGGEPVGDITVRASALRGVAVPPDRAPSMIDEYPILAVAAACAEGETHMAGLAELRVKESDRLAMIAQGLSACGVSVTAEADSLTVRGTGHPPPGGATVATALDHRIAMSFLVLGQVTEAPVAIDDAAAIATSFPGFMELMVGLGADIAPA